MPIGFGLDVKGIVEDEADQSFTAPLPVLSLRMDLVLAPKWYFRSRSQLFYIEYENYTGRFLNIQSKVEYNPWKHVGLGLGVESLRMNLQADGEEVFQGFDLRGNIGFTYVGLFLYGRVYF